MTRGGAPRSWAGGIGRASGLLLALVGCAPHGDDAAGAVRIVDLTPGEAGCAAWSDGHVDCWRRGGAAERVEGVQDATSVALYGGSGCARRRGGEVECWSLDELSARAPVPALADAEQLAGNAGLLCARRASTVTCVSKAIAAPIIAALPDARDLSVSRSVCAATADGGVSCLLHDGATRPITGITGATRVAAGDRFGCAIVEDGAVDCWSNERPDSAGEPPYDSPVMAPTRVPIREDVVELAAADDVACARTRAGVVYCWGNANWLHVGAEPTPVPALEGTQRLILSAMVGCGVLSETRARCLDRAGKPFEIAREPEPAPLDAGEPALDRVSSLNTICVRTPARTIRCGDNEWPGTHDALQASHEQVCSVDAGRVLCSRRSYAALVAPSSDPNGRASLQPPHAVQGVDDAAAIAVGERFVCALRADHSVWCWGGNSFGQSGVARPYVAAKRVRGISDAIDVSIDLDRACALERRGAIKCWRPSAERRYALRHSVTRGYVPRDYDDLPVYETYAPETRAEASGGRLILGHTVDPEMIGKKSNGPALFGCVLRPDGVSECHGACPEMPVPRECASRRAEAP